MEYTRLGDSDLRVSRICLGSMIWGDQNTQQEAFDQLDCGLDLGVNFIDTAEMYSVPSRADTYGASETIIGNWMRARGNRDKVVIATKAAGPCADWMPHIRDAGTRLDRPNIEQAIDGSLDRLQTDYVDLYQLHWPQRKTNYFGRLGYTHEPTEDWIPLEETLDALAGLVERGKVRAVGVSNETPWGLMRFLFAAERLGLPRMASIQNPYNLLNRSFEIGLAEICMRENIGCLPYSPLAFGMLSGKYLGEAGPAARLNRPEFKRFTRYTNPLPRLATEKYAAVARKFDLDMAQMALAYVNSRPFVASNIIGTSSVAQVRENVASLELALGEEVLQAIEDVHKTHPNPAP
ncbi:MAG: aldo/keto reductase [Gammaproteobacteria bacterium]|nr:aldo/keto reductase [Gammaproteobacteria bacterium]